MEKEELVFVFHIWVYDLVHRSPGAWVPFSRWPTSPRPWSTSLKLSALTYLLVQ